MLYCFSFIVLIRFLIILESDARVMKVLWSTIGLSKEEERKEIEVEELLQQKTYHQLFGDISFKVIYKVTNNVPAASQVIQHFPLTLHQGNSLSLSWWPGPLGLENKTTEVREARVSSGRKVNEASSICPAEFNNGYRVWTHFLRVVTVNTPSPSVLATPWCWRPVWGLYADN